MKSPVALAVLFLATEHGVLSQAPPISEAPPAIEELASVIPGMRAADVRAEVVKRFGAPQRDVGSGGPIEEWDLFDGILRLSYLGGEPTFSDPGAGKLFRLIPTRTPAAVSIAGPYGLATQPDPRNHGNRFYLGTVRLAPEGTYQFNESDQLVDHRGGQGDNFFLLCPQGTAVVRLEPPVTGDTPLESLPEDTAIARLELACADGSATATFMLTSSERARTLSFSADNALPYVLDKHWNLRDLPALQAPSPATRGAGDFGCYPTTR